jgi:nucleotide-binding universal stress UspA family protein
MGRGTVFLIDRETPNERRDSMFEKILYPTDFSDVSRKAMDYIKQLKSVGAKKVIVLHVIDERAVEAADRYSPQS